jgi:hypothetical protein
LSAHWPGRVAKVKSRPRRARSTRSSRRARLPFAIRPRWTYIRDLRGRCPLSAHWPGRVAEVKSRPRRARSTRSSRRARLPSPSVRGGRGERGVQGELGYVSQSPRRRPRSAYRPRNVGNRYPFNTLPNTDPFPNSTRGECSRPTPRVSLRGSAERYARRACRARDHLSRVRPTLR